MKRTKTVTVTIEELLKILKLPSDASALVRNPHEDYTDVTNPQEIEFKWEQEV